MSNILQQEDRIKGMPTEWIVGQLKNPTGEYPSFLLLSALEGRKKEMEDYANEQKQMPEKSVLEQFNANISKLTDALEKQKGVGDAAMMENLTEQSGKLKEAFMSVTTDALKAAGQLSHLATILEKIEDPDARKEIQKTLGEMKELFNKSVADQKPAQTNQQNMSIDPKLVEKQSTETAMMSTEPEGN